MPARAFKSEYGLRGCWCFYYCGFLATVRVFMGRYSPGCGLLCATEPDAQHAEAAAQWRIPKLPAISYVRPVQRRNYTCVWYHSQYLQQATTRRFIIHIYM